MQNIILDMFESVFYPPTEDQLAMMGYFLNSLWLVRIFSLVVLLVALYFWHKIITRLVGKEISLISSLIILLSPTFYVLWLTCPIDCFKILGVLFLIYVCGKRKMNWGKIVLILGSIFLILFSLLTTPQRSSFVNRISLKNSAVESQNRFIAEDSLTNPIKIPLTIKRMVYNKYFIVYKEVIGEVIPFLDMESLFFQEVHPLEQKSIVIFVWPEIFLLIGGVFVLIKLKNKKINHLINIMLFFSFVNFLLTPFGVFRKFELILFPLALVMALAVVKIYKTKILFGKIFGNIVTLFCLYGIMANYVDLNKRPDFWLDNRPYFYEFIFKSIEEKDISKFEKIYVSSLVGNSEKYCRYYFRNCDKNKFVFNSFDLEKTRPEKNTIYAGFVGEFVGSDPKNMINSDWLTLIKDKGFTELEIKNIRDNIAYKFGNEVIVGEAR